MVELKLKSDWELLKKTFLHLWINMIMNALNDDNDCKSIKFNEFRLKWRSISGFSKHWDLYLLKGDEE